MENIKLLLYCCKDKRGYLHFDTRKEITRKYYLSPDSSPFGTYEPDNYLNGKILAECDFEVEEIKHYIVHAPEVNIGVAVLPAEDVEAYCTETLNHFKLLEKSCLTEGQLYGYLENGTGYAIHIKNLHIFDEPKELSEFGSYDSKNANPYCYWKDNYNLIQKAPQNMMYATDMKTGKNYILISIRPEWMCLILNKDKDVELRKKVLKGMIE